MFIIGKGKPRHNPQKPQNRLGGICSYYEEDLNGFGRCEISKGQISVCEGNPHNCIKCKYKKLAIKDTKNPNCW